MGPRGMGFMGFGDRRNDNLKEPPPKSLKDVPRFVRNITKSFFSRLFYIFGLVWETRKWILFVMLFMALFNGFMPVIGSVISASLLNSIASAYMKKTEFSAVMSLLLIQFGYIIFQSIVNNVNTILTRVYGELVVNHVKVKIMHKAKEIDLSNFDQPEFYSKLENASREAGNRPIHILNSTFSIISTCISIFSYIIILWAVSPAAPFIIIAMSVPSAIVNFIYRRKNVMYVRYRSKERRQMSYYSSLMTNKDMVKEIRMYHLSDLFIDSYNDVFGKYFKGLKKLFIGEGSWHIGITVVSSIVNCSLFLFIAKQVCDGNIQIGDYSLYTGALRSISNGVNSFINTTASIYEGTLFIDNMIDFMKAEKRITPQLSEPLKVKRGIGHTIEFKNVSFRYPGTERDVIKNVSLTLNPGETAVLVGLNGTGKTTLIKLLTRLYDPTEGCIILDGHDLRDYEVEGLYGMFGIIFQDFGKYAFDVKSNIAFGEISKPVVNSEIEEAAAASNAREFIEALPDKFDTPLMRYFEDNGIELSIGQWQKLAIARAFYSDSDFLILDEPTASLDAIAEQEIFNQFDKLRKDKTTIYVSHRLSSATTASKIVVLQYGEIIEEGTHSELMAAKGHYYTLFSTQAKRYISPDGEINTNDEANVPDMQDRPPHRRRPPQITQ